MQAATTTPSASQQAVAAAPSASQQSAEACDTVISSLKKQRQKYARAKAPFGNVTWAQRARQLGAAVGFVCALHRRHAAMHVSVMTHELAKITKSRRHNDVPPNQQPDAVCALILALSCCQSTAEHQGVSSGRTTLHRLRR